jgi:hypothetical protein
LKSADIKKDYFAFAVLIAIIAGIVSQYYSYLYDYTYAYRDAIYRMEAARRFFDSSTPGIINQLGTVWLPVPNLILMPLAYIDYLWQTGLAASIINFPLYVISSALIFLSIKKITNSVTGSWFGFLIFVFNCNVLYFQTTAMTEQLYLTFIIGSFYFMLLWVHEKQTKHLIYASALIALGTGTRYDAWPVALVSIIIISIICILDKDKPVKNTLIFSSISLLFIVFWLLYNLIRFGDILEFSRGEYSTLNQLKYYEEQGRLLTKNNFWLSSKVYFSSVILYCGGLFSLISVLGLPAYIFKNRFSTKSLPVYVLWVALPTTLFLLYKGQLIIEIPDSEPPGYFNSRYGLYLFPAIAVFCGIAAAYLANMKNRVVFISFLVYLFVLQQLKFWDDFPVNVPAIAEAKYSNSKTSENLSYYLKINYKGGYILYDNVIFALHPWTGINLIDRITPFTFIIGEQAMKDPGRFVNWVLVYKNAPNDRVYAAIINNPDFLNNFELKFSENGVEAYQKK